MIYKSSQKIKLMSNIFRFPDAVPKETSDVPSLCKSFKLMLNQGIIKPVGPGIFNLMPFAIRALEKLCNLVNALMNEVDGQKVLFPVLIQDTFLKTSGRWHDNSNLFKLTDRNLLHYCLGPTHEEIATSLLSKFRISYKNLPLRLYQISTKFRDEMNPKLGLLRGREFIMKDMYTFDVDEENALATYHLLCNIYHKLFNVLGIEHVKVKGSCGDMGGKLSHEFHFLSKIGEDKIFYCPNCKEGINNELYDGNETKCEKCNINYNESSAIEVGHAFFLGTTYSKPFQAKFNSSTQIYKNLQMGCYGLGLTRILASCVEVLSSVDSIRWPIHIAPYFLSIIPPKKGSKEAAATSYGECLSHSLNKIEHLSFNIVIDDRTNLTIGRRIQDASALGIPYALVIGSKVLENLPKSEVIDIYKGQTYFLSHRETLDFFRNIFESC